MNDTFVGGGPDRDVCLPPLAASARDTLTMLSQRETARERMRENAPQRRSDCRILSIVSAGPTLAAEAKLGWPLALPGLDRVALAMAMASQTKNRMSPFKTMYPCSMYRLIIASRHGAASKIRRDMPLAVSVRFTFVRSSHANHESINQSINQFSSISNP